ncbi:F-box protein SKIP24 isoform X3 [Morus notabilis]|uniref:F-box protein SKIP24 isoform X3 n=1 Tax=Morus notabilis TaxID=981085 RepID=UPI000CED0C9F|nr:F-box protein SKIP24 isoform X3 [Morus notabilis]
MSDLPDELWRRILEIGVQTCGFTYKDLCCLSISSRRLHRLSDDDELWSVLLSSNFCLIDRSASPSLASKSLYKFRFEREKEKKIAAHRRAVLRKESQIAEHSRKIREFENSLAVESDKMRATLVELSNLRKIRQASVALNVWQPEVVRGKIKQVVEQNAVPVESRVHALEMELKLCKQQISGFEKAYKDEKRRFDVAKEELKSMRYHPLRPNESMSSVKDVCETNIRAKKMKRCSKEPSWQFAPFASTFLSRYKFCKRGIQTQKEPISPAGEDLQEDSVSMRPTSDSFKVSTLQNKALRASS